MPRLIYMTLVLGQNVEAAKKILADSNLPIITADGFEDGAKKAVACAQAANSN